MRTPDSRCHSEKSNIYEAITLIAVKHKDEYPDLQHEVDSDGAISNNKDYIPIEKTEYTRKKTFIYDFDGGVTKILGIYLMKIYKQQKFTFKSTIEFSFY